MQKQRKKNYLIYALNHENLILPPLRGFESSTLTSCPSMVVPFSSSIAALASRSSSIVINAYPRKKKIMPSSSFRSKKIWAGPKLFWSWVKKQNSVVKSCFRSISKIFRNYSKYILDLSSVHLIWDLESLHLIQWCNFFEMKKNNFQKKIQVWDIIGALIQYL